MSTGTVTSTGMYYDNVELAQDNIVTLMQAAQSGSPVQIRNNSSLAALIDANSLRTLLNDVFPADAIFTTDPQGWNLIIRRLPVQASASTRPAVITEMVFALRDYAHQWITDDTVKEEYATHWGIIQLIALSDDDQLATWLSNPRT